MDFDPACLEFLEHFDRPKTADVTESKREAEDKLSQPLADWGLADARPQPPAAGLTSWDLIDALPRRSPQTRGVAWVLQWAAALAVLVMAASMLAQFGYLIAAENALNVAAQAGAVEATLPRATCQSVAAAVERRLAEYPQLGEQLHLNLLQNGSPIDRLIRTGEGDRFTITLSAPSSAMMPAWLCKLSPRRGDTTITAHAERQAPGRKLRPAS